MQDKTAGNQNVVNTESGHHIEMCVNPPVSVSIDIEPPEVGSATASPRTSLNSRTSTESSIASSANAQQAAVAAAETGHKRKDRKVECVERHGTTHKHRVYQFLALIQILLGLSVIGCFLVIGNHEPSYTLHIVEFALCLGSILLLIFRISFSKYAYGKFSFNPCSFVFLVACIVSTVYSGIELSSNPVFCGNHCISH